MDEREYQHADLDRRVAELEMRQRGRDTGQTATGCAVLLLVLILLIIRIVHPAWFDVVWLPFAQAVVRAGSGG